MPAISHLNPTWEHTLTDILNHDPKTQMGIIMRAWVKDNNMTDFTSMLTYTADKFTPTGFLCYYKEKVDAKHKIQHQFQTLNQNACYFTPKPYMGTHPH